jgi:hypothetical protein
MDKATTAAKAVRQWSRRQYVWRWDGQGRKALAGLASLVRWTDQEIDRMFLAGVGDQALSSAGFAMLGMPSGCRRPA